MTIRTSWLHAASGRHLAHYDFDVESCGSIINFSSVKGLVGSDRPAYAAAKGGIVALTRTMSAQCAQYGIRVNAIAPGSVLTERTAKEH